MPVMGLEKFYGRTVILDLLRKRVLDFKDGYRQNVALVGDRYLGKTFILHKFFSEVAAKDTVQIYVDIEYKDVNYFCSKLCGSILYEFSKIRTLPLHEELNLLVESTQYHLPKTVLLIKKVQKLLRHGKTTEAYKEIIMLPQAFSLETGLFCLCVFDEFHCMEEWGITDVFQELGKMIMMQKQCMYVFASSCHDYAKTILSEKLSLLFGNFEVVEVGSLDLKTCQEYVIQHLAHVMIGNDLRDFLIDFTGGYPLYLRLLCEDLVRLAAVHGQKEVFLPLLSGAVEDTLFNPWGVLSRHFDLIIHQLCSGKGNLINADILIALSDGKQKIKDFSDRLGSKQGSINSRLNRLQELGIVAKSGRSFYVCDRLLKYWLSYVFRPHREAMEIDPLHRREQFRAEFTCAVEDFRAQSRRDVSSRIVELFHCFDDESFQMDGRRYKLPIFEAVAEEKTERPAGSGFNVIRAATLDGDWVILLKSGEVNEQDLTLAISEVKERLVKPQRCVLISLKDLDESVRVRALQERMWIWNEREVRMLLHLYNKPYIVV